MKRCTLQATRSELPKCLLLDPCPQSGAFHDANPLGTYRTEHNGSVVFEQARIALPGYVKCRSTTDVDKLIARVLIAAAKHARRYLIVDDRTLKGTLWRLPEGRMWHGPGVKLEGAVLVKALPKGMIVHVAGFPEDFGRLCYDSTGFGVSITAVHKLSIFEVVPAITLETRPTVVG